MLLRLKYHCTSFRRFGSIDTNIIYRNINDKIFVVILPCGLIRKFINNSNHSKKYIKGFRYGYNNKNRNYYHKARKIKYLLNGC